MKKKLLLVLCIFTMCFTLTGCDLVNEINEIINENMKNQQENTAITNDEDFDLDDDNNYDDSTNMDMELYLDDTKIVFEFGGAKHVFFYQGDKITSYRSYIDYKTPEAAKLADQTININELDTVDKHYTEGKYVVLEYNKSLYENLTVSQVKQAYSYMDEVLGS